MRRPAGPTALALVAVTFPAERARARAFRVLGTISMAGGAIGPRREATTHAPDRVPAAPAPGTGAGS
ncbi:hypothetical protein [Streptomyces sp. NPDC029554]|uniref:hypothetical protein n=1 Tax=Streptomyces sp. NPDC029554 TaxID=3155126 RepID=UPI003401648A